jgi:DNA polymerase
MKPEERQQALDAIAAEVAACTLCPLHAAGRTRTVPGDGAINADIMFIGEAPGFHEDKQGLPFVGASGKYLEELLAGIGLKRQDVFIANVVKCRPPENRDPKPEEIASCLPFFKRQLEVIQPEVIVALGAHAARTLLETNDAIGQLRGRFHEYRFSENVPPAKLMPTYHPAYLLRNYSYDNRKRVWEDMMKVLKELGMPLPAKKD